jgi:hypothetical protein
MTVRRTLGGRLETNAVVHSSSSVHGSLWVVSAVSYSGMGEANDLVLGFNGAHMSRYSTIIGDCSLGVLGLGH